MIWIIDWRGYMKRFFPVMIVLAILIGLVGLAVFGEEAPVSAVPTSTAEPEGLVLDASVVFAILIAAAAVGVGAGYWYARKR